MNFKAVMDIYLRKMSGKNYTFVRVDTTVSKDIIKIATTESVVVGLNCNFEFAEVYEGYTTWWKVATSF